MPQIYSSTDEEVPVQRLRRSSSLPVESGSSQREQAAKGLGAAAAAAAKYIKSKNNAKHAASSRVQSDIIPPDPPNHPADYEYERRAPVSGTNRREDDYSDASDAEDRGQHRDHGVRFDEADNTYYARRSSSDEDDDDRYFFTGSWTSSSVTSLASEAPSTGKDGSVESSTPVLPSVPSMNTSTQVKEMRIRESKYEGDACQDGNHTARLTLLDDAKNPQHVLFKWVYLRLRHIEQQVMSFDKFYEEIFKISNLTESEKSGIKKLLAEVRKTCIKSLTTGKGSCSNMEPKVVSQRLQADENTSSSQRSQPRTVYWINLPFFYLKKYSSETATAKAFPVQTLMQADNSRNPRDRDMKQAIHRIRSAEADVPKDYCFHIAQIWCVIVDNSLLVSCSVMSEAALRGDLIEIIRTPPRGLSTESDIAKILVAYKGSVLWAIPLRECRTWFSFILHFWEFWPFNIRFYRRKKALAAEDWNNIVEEAGHLNKKIVLDAKLKSLPSPPMRAELTVIMEPVKKQGIPEGDTASISKAPSGGGSDATSAVPQNLDQEFSVFTWLKLERGVSKTAAAQLELKRIDEFLQGRTRVKDRRAYRECSETTYDEVRLMLQRLVVDRKLAEMKEGSAIRMAVEDRIDIFNVAIIIFRYFLPLQFSGPTVNKFWGGLKVLLDRPWPGKADDEKDLKPTPLTSRQRTADSNVLPVRKSFRSLSREIQLFQNIMSHASAEAKAKFEPPTQILEAWIYLILANIYSSTDLDTFQSYLGTASTLLQSGIRKILKSLSTSTLLTVSSVLPTELLSMMGLKVLKDVTSMSGSTNISKIYSQCIEDLKVQIEKKPAVFHIEKTQYLITEIKVIMKVLKQQRDVFLSISRRASSSSDNDSREEGRETTDSTSANIRTASHDIYSSRSRESYSSRSRDNYSSRSRDNYSSRSRDNYSSRSRTQRDSRTRSGEGSRSYLQVEEVRRDFPPPGDASSRRPAQYYHDDEYSVASDGGYTEDLGDGNKLESTDSRGFRDLLASDCLRIVNQRIYDFGQLETQVKDLQWDNSQKVETRKDYHDQALYAFTIVTIVFLPLSSVASIVAIDPSSMQIYWATAIPVTVVVIIIALWWIGELGRVLLYMLLWPFMLCFGKSLANKRREYEDSDSDSSDEHYRYKRDRRSRRLV